MASQMTQDLYLTEDSKKVVRIAQAVARENMNAVFTPAHLLKATCAQGGWPTRPH